MLCLGRVLFAAAPRSLAAALDEALQLPSSAGGFAWRALGVACIAAAGTVNSNPAFTVNWCIPFYAALSCISLRVLICYDESGGTSSAGGVDGAAGGVGGGMGGGVGGGEGRLARRLRGCRCSD